MSVDINIAALDAALSKRINEQKLPGVSVCIYGPEGVVFRRGYGYCDEAKTRPVDADTIMGIASMSKSTAALSLAILEANGKCSFSDPVDKYFPNFRLRGTPRGTVTLADLASHTAGIPPMEPLEWSIAMNTTGRDSEWARIMRAGSPNAMDSIEQVVDYIAEGRYPTLGAPGEYMSYSNEGYAILSYIVDMAAGEPLEAFLSRYVFGPCGMTRSVLDNDASQAKVLASDGNITSLWERDEEGNFTTDDDWSILPPFRACACVKSTAYDMARYYSCISNGGVIDGVRALPAEACERLVGAGFALSEKPLYCFGLNKRAWKGHIICEHSGGLHGVSSHGGMLWGEGYGFAALCNEGGQDTDDLCWLMYNAVMGTELSEKHIWLHPEGEFSEPEMIEGEYICHEGIPETLKVYREDGRLRALRGERQLTLRYCGGTWFQLVDSAGELAGRLHFWIRSGKAWGVQVYTRVYLRVE